MKKNNYSTSVSTNYTSRKLFIITCAIVYILAYLIRYLYIGYFVYNNYNFDDINPDWNAILPRALFESFVISTVVFFVFFGLSYFRIKSSAYLHVSYKIPGIYSKISIFVIIIFCIGMRVAYGSRLGEEITPMPFGLNAPVNRTIDNIIPGLLLLMMECCWFNGKIKSYRAWIFLLAIFNITIAALATSKAGMVFFAAELMMFMYLTGQPIFKRPIMWVVVGFLVLVAFAVGTELRARAGGGTSEYSTLFADGDYLGVLFLVAGTFLNRLVGLEGYALSCGYSCSTLPAFSALNFHSFLGEAGRIFTQEVVRVGQDFDYRSPGLLGGAALLAGTFGGALLVLVFLRGALTVLDFADRKEFSVACKVTVVIGLFRFISEGAWMAVDLLAVALGATLVEICARALRSGRQQPELPGHGARTNELELG